MTGRRLVLVLVVAVLLAFFALALSGMLVVQGPVSTPVPSGSELAAPAVTCSSEPGPLPSMLATDPCPAAETAVKLAVAPVRLPIRRIVIEPGPFFCSDLWPGVGSPPSCYGPVFRPGQFMHAWVGFWGSGDVAAVLLGLDLPNDLDGPGQTRPPWSATLVSVEAPPAGWVMP